MKREGNVSDPLAKVPRKRAATESHVGPCALCGEEAELVKGHIVPNFLHRGVFDEKHMTLRAGQVASDVRMDLVPSGYYERLLCATCDNERIGSLETYAKEAWDTKIPRRVSLGSSVTIDGLDYCRFKLFMLSVLWRAHVSKREQFEMVNLGPHGERIRRMLLRSEPGKRRDYPFTGVLLVEDDGTLYDRAISSPESKRILAHTLYRWFFGGVIWAYRVSSHPYAELDSAALGLDGRLVLRVQRWRESEMIRSFVKRLFGRRDAGSKRGGRP